MNRLLLTLVVILYVVQLINIIRTFDRDFCTRMEKIDTFAGTVYLCLRRNTTTLY
jgi:hypothetical protein